LNVGLKNRYLSGQNCNTVGCEPVVAAETSILDLLVVSFDRSLRLETFESAVQRTHRQLDCTAR
jgi:hypothetical protein